MRTQVVGVDRMKPRRGLPLLYPLAQRINPENWFIIERIDCHDVLIKHLLKQSPILVVQSYTV
jgi:hypothetical protein